MAPDIEALLDSIIERIGDQVLALDGVTDGESLLDAFQRTTSGDWAYVIDAGETGKGRHAQNAPGQVETLDLSVVVVSTNFRSKEAGRSGNTALRRAIKNVLCGDRNWKPTDALRPLEFRRSRFYARTRGRVGYEMQFKTEVFNDYQD